MGFNPDAYGNPKARRGPDGALEDQSQIEPDPGWGLPARRPVSQQSSWISRQSAQSGVRIQSEDNFGDQEVSQEVASSTVRSGEGQPCVPDLRVEEHTPARSVSNLTSHGSTTPFVVNIPGFDKAAYGWREKVAQSTSRSPEPRQPSGSPHRQGQQEVSAVTQNKVNLSDTKAGPDNRTLHLTPQRTSSHLAINNLKQTALANSTMQATMNRQAPQSQTTSSQIDSAKKSESMHTPQTFETLKQGTESPEQMIARLQAAGVREVSLRNRRKDQGEIPITTALATLDLLRKPLPPNSTDPHPTATNTQSRVLADRDPNLSLNQSLHAYVGSTNNSFTESKIDRKEKRLWEKQIMNPALWDEAAVQSSATMCEGWANTNSQPGNIVGIGNDPSGQPHNNPGTWNEGAAQGTRVVPVRAEPDSESDGPSQRALQRKPNQQVARRSRWATNAELKAPPVKPDSNAEGSEELESDDDSTRPMAKGFGRLIRSRVPLIREEQLVGWDGNLQPPPLEWEHRPQFYNNTPEYISGFDGWLGDVTVQKMSDKSAPEVNFGVLPLDEVMNPDNHADGVGFAPRETVLDPSNAERYGHRLASALKPDPLHPTDFEGDAKLDLRDPDNARYKDETAKVFIDRRMEYLKRAQKEADGKTKLAQEAEREHAAAMAAEAEAAEIQQAKKPAEPITSINVYLRPAVQADAPGIMTILNWHINNGIRPSELAAITEDDVIHRMSMSQDARLPVIVAVERTRRSSRSRSRKYPRVNPNHPIQNIDPDYLGVTRDEPIVGFASATDWSASDYIETITAELEVYVASNHRKSGVGRCLLDALLEATDRGYVKKGGYEFRVAPEMKHMYSTGGGRDLHKLIFQVRSFNQPMTQEQIGRMRRAAMGKPDPPLNVGAARRNGYGNVPNQQVNKEDESPEKASKSTKVDDREDDYEIWLKEWLEGYGFEEEAHLKKLGTKKGRFVDVRYVSRETCWQPADYRIPEYTNGI